MRIKGRIPKGDGHGWASRDYAPFVKCRVSYCPCNNKSGQCELPSEIEIRADGVCQKAIDFKPK